MDIHTNTIALFKITPTQPHLLAKFREVLNTISFYDINQAINADPFIQNERMKWISTWKKLTCWPTSRAWWWWLPLSSAKAWKLLSRSDVWNEVKSLIKKVFPSKPHDTIQHLYRTFKLNRHEIFLLSKPPQMAVFLLVWLCAKF